MKRIFVLLFPIAPIGIPSLINISKYWQIKFFFSTYSGEKRNSGKNCRKSFR